MSCHDMATYPTKIERLQISLMDGQGIGIFDSAKGDRLATFNVTHTPDKSAKARFVGALEFAVRI